MREPDPQELQWLQQLRADDVQGFNALFRHYSVRLYRFAFSYLRDRPAAEEVVQECFLKIWEKRADVRTDVPLKSYLFTIAHHVILNQLRQQQRHQQYQARQESVLTGLSEALPGNAVEFAELEALYQEALERLPPKRRQVFLLSRQQGLSYAEIARELGLSVKTVETQMTQALRFLESYLRMHGVRLMWPLLLVALASLEPTLVAGWLRAVA